MIPIGIERAQDLSSSANKFATIVVPILREHLIGDGYYWQLENSCSDLIERLDIMGGIDSVYEGDGYLLRLSSRVRSGLCRQCFEIRFSRDSGRDSEWAKVKRAIDLGGIYTSLKNNPGYLDLHLPTTQCS